MPVLFDVDTGVDDAIALVLACASEQLDILAAGAVSGNSGIDNTLRNTMDVLHYLGRGDIPVARGADKPYARPETKRGNVHGGNGLVDYRFSEPSTAAPHPLPAWELYYQKLMQSPDKVTIVALGPVTNIAHLYDKHPDAKEKIDKIIFMGGAYRCGNPTEVATANVLMDPEGFRRVLHGGVDIHACTLDMTRKSYMTPEEVAALRDIPGRGAALICALLEHYNGGSNEANLRITLEPDSPDLGNHPRRPGYKVVHDLAAMMYLLHPEIFEGEKVYCGVECKGELTTGWTLIDVVGYYNKKESEKNFVYVHSVDRKKHYRYFCDLLRTYS